MKQKYIDYQTVVTFWHLKQEALGIALCLEYKLKRLSIWRFWHDVNRLNKVFINIVLELS